MTKVQKNIVVVTPEDATPFLTETIVAEATGLATERAQFVADNYDQLRTTYTDAMGGIRTIAIVSGREREFAAYMTAIDKCRASCMGVEDHAVFAAETRNYARALGAATPMACNGVTMTVRDVIYALLPNTSEWLPGYPDLTTDRYQSALSILAESPLLGQALNPTLKRLLVFSDTIDKSSARGDMWGVLRNAKYEVLGMDREHHGRWIFSRLCRFLDEQTDERLAALFVERHSFRNDLMQLPVVDGYIEHGSLAASKHRRIMTALTINNRNAVVQAYKLRLHTPSQENIVTNKWATYRAVDEAIANVRTTIIPEKYRTEPLHS